MIHLYNEGRQWVSQLDRGEWRREINGMRFETRRQAMDEVMDWLTYYNHRRLHSTLGYISPMQFEKNWFAAELKKAA